MNQPKPFCFNRSKVKAFILGCDPTNESNRGKRVDLEFAFGVGKDARYFRPILENLKQLGLHLEDLYIQNLMVDYQKEETSKNKNWKQDASGYLKLRINEFSLIDPQRKLPVFLTSHELYDVLSDGSINQQTPEELYRAANSIPILPNQNKLGWNLFPLFRNKRYNLECWPEYKNEIIEYLNSI